MSNIAAITLPTTPAAPAQTTIATAPAAAPASAPAVATTITATPATTPSAGDALGIAEKVAAVRREERRVAQLAETHKADLAELATYRAAKADPLAYIKLGGHTLEAVQMAHLAAAKAADPAAKATADSAAANARVAALEEDIKRERIEREGMRVRSDIERQIAAAAPETVDLLRVYRARDGEYTGLDLVCDTIRAKWEADHEDMPIADAIAAVEKVLADEWMPSVAKSTKLAAHYRTQFEAEAKAKQTEKAAGQATARSRTADGPPTLRDADATVVTAGNGADDWRSTVARVAARLNGEQP